MQLQNTSVSVTTQTLYPLFYALFSNCLHVAFSWRVSPGLETPTVSLITRVGTWPRELWRPQRKFKLSDNKMSLSWCPWKTKQIIPRKEERLNLYLILLMIMVSSTKWGNNYNSIKNSRHKSKIKFYSFLCLLLNFNDF